MNTVSLGIIENNLYHNIFISSGPSHKSTVRNRANPRRACSVATAISAL